MNISIYYLQRANASPTSHHFHKPPPEGVLHSGDGERAMDAQTGFEDEEEAEDEDEDPLPTSPPVDEAGTLLRLPPLKR